MGHLLKRKRGLEHPLQWIKRCGVPVSTELPAFVRSLLNRGFEAAGFVLEVERLVGLSTPVEQGLLWDQPWGPP